MSQDAGSILRKSTAANREYKERLNQLFEFINRLEKVRHSLYSINEPPGRGQGPVTAELKKISPDIAFLEIWQDHTEYFTSLLNQLERVVQELEEF